MPIFPYENVAVIFASLGALLLLVRYHLYPKPLPGIPHPPFTTIWGNIPELGEAIKTHQALSGPFFERYARELGPIYQTMIGPNPMVILSDPVEIEDMLLRARSKSLDTSATAMGVFNGVLPKSQIALPMHDLWKKHRRLSGPSMSATFLKQTSSRIAVNALALVSYWKDKMLAIRAKGGKSFDCFDDLEISTLDTMAETIFGETVGGIQSYHAALNQVASAAVVDDFGGTTFPEHERTRLYQAVHHHFKKMEGAAKVPPMLLKAYWFFVTRTSVFRKHDAVIKNLIRSKINEARARSTNVEATGRSEMADCIIDMIIERAQQEGGEQQSDSELLDELMGFVFAGHDTTASVLGFSTRFLAKHPQVQKKLHTELLTQLNEPENRILTYEDVSSPQKTPYLEAVAHEILRLAGVVGTIPREAQEDMIISGKHIPKGTQILILLGMCGRVATRSWIEARDAPPNASKPTKGAWNGDDVNDFIPERWLVPDSDGGVAFSASQGYSMPFGLGYRSCFGQKLAIVKLKLYLANINLGGFLDHVPEQLLDSGIHEMLSIKPRTSHVSYIDWSDVKDL
ncbi:hypothetical protein FRC02_010250 [Tulasnella sp. 418]|nr:hypothetical protein FRC02_010250 [Tulasnella sp. 418]